MAAQVPAQGAGAANSYGGQPVTSPVGPPAATTTAGTTGGAMSNQNLNQIVRDILLGLGPLLFSRSQRCLGARPTHLHSLSNTIVHVFCAEVPVALYLPPFPSPLLAIDDATS